MRPELKYLSDQELKRVHQKALDMLWDMGMQFENSEARDYFAKAGAVVEGDIVKIPGDIVEKALETVPKRDKFILYGRTPEHDVKVP